MTEQELRKRIGIGENQLVNTNHGLVDIFAVRDGRITYGFLASGTMKSETIKEFLERFDGA